MNKRGIALILGFTIIVVLTVLGAAIVSSSISERALTEKSNASRKAFWAAEAGIAAAAAALPDLTAAANVGDNDFDDSGKLGYYIPQDLPPNPAPVSGFSNRWMITSTGRYIFNETTPPIERTVVAIVEKTGTANSILITNAVETTGELSVRGSVDINPDGSYEDDSDLSFEGVFGMSKDEVKALADRVYTDPPTNQQPVNGITWVDLTGANKYSISSNWSGSGLLIVNGNGEDVGLEISGEWTFEGVIWVVGKLKISGTPTISGAVFAESGADVENTLTGNATLNFDAEAKDSAFNLISAETASNILSWQEQAN